MSLKPNSAKDRVIVALDFDTIDGALKVAQELNGVVNHFKVGLEVGTHEGWGSALEKLRQAVPEISVFCDTKFKDIPNTIRGASKAIQSHRPFMFNVMTDNTEAALSAAKQGADAAVEEYRIDEPALILGVTVLTSISDAQSEEIYGARVEEKVMQFARASKQAGLNGLVCSPKEAEMLKSDPSTADLALVCPSIRPEWAQKGDQARAVTPAEAIKLGADYLVIGRPITRPPDGLSIRQAAEKIIEEVENS